MSIKQVDNIPTTLSGQRKSYREMIRNDINEAIDNRISKFEFEGEYNYKYLAQYVREEADRVFRKLYFPVERKVKEVLQKEFEKEYIFCESSYKYSKKFINITSKKLEDRIHVYAEIDFEFLDNLFDVVLFDTKNKYLKIANKTGEY